MNKKIEDFKMNKWFIIFGTKEVSIQEIYLDYINNFLTIEKWAEHYGLNEKQAEFILSSFKD